MQNTPTLFMLLLGCKPKGRHTEQHDVFFGIADSLKELVPAMNEFWPEGKKNLHLDAWRVVTKVQSYTVQLKPKTEAPADSALKLFFINLGGYRKDEFEEFHQKILLVAKDSSEAIALAKQEVFYKQTGFRGASAHVDDKYGFEVDEIYNIEEILPPSFSSLYTVHVSQQEEAGPEDPIHLGYLPLWKIK